MLANWIGASMDEITYVCAGVNHQAWYVEYKRNGKDAYPFIREAVKKKKIYNQEQVRNEMFLHLDYYVTESSGHNSEYNWWFRKRPDLIKKYCLKGKNWNPGVHGYILKEYRKRANTWKDAIVEWLDKDEPIDLARGHEYAASIINAWQGGEIFRFNGNVSNTGLIPNLPEGACVEVPVLAGRSQIDKLIKAHLGVGSETIEGLLAQSGDDRLELLDEVETDGSELSEMAQEPSGRRWE